jgi:tetratricopeptide (TPR) repeat protein
MRVRVLTVLAASALCVWPIPVAAIQTASTQGNTVNIDPAPDPNPDSIKIDEAWEIIQAGTPADALPILDGIIDRSEKAYSGETRQIFSARSLPETFLYTTLAAAAKKNALVVDDTWGMAHFLKGFALVDLNRPDEAKAQLDRAIELAPMNAQFLAERGEWHKNRKDWAKAYADFESASTAAEFSPDDIKNNHKARALRGMGFVKIELGELKEAEKLFKQSHKLEPDNPNARSELEYIKSLNRT